MSLLKKLESEYDKTSKCHVDEYVAGYKDGLFYSICKAKKHISVRNQVIILVTIFLSVLWFFSVVVAWNCGMRYKVEKGYEVIEIEASRK